jgi:hypothetical protein
MSSERVIHVMHGITETNIDNCDVRMIVMEIIMAWHGLAMIGIDTLRIGTG